MEPQAMNITDDDLERALRLTFDDPTGLESHLAGLQSETRSRYRRPRTRRRLIVGLSVAAALTVGAGAAVASPIHFPWETEPSDVSGTVVFPSGDICETAFTAMGDYTQPETYDQIMAAGKAGSRYLATLDISGLDYAAALRKAAREIPTDPDGVPTAPLSLQMQENNAVFSVVFEKMTAAVKQQGYQAGASLEGEAHCRKAGERG
jgi:hypothetical protein